ncbi:type III secretion system export apparatus subunit SctS [Pacificimonas sp. WHA3]|uniref:Type III secretion system export apparatus subunit SctS n=1 Tax=Pacificimonas pallii TaxID=2827236 RepID=A0ABS6SGF8_9SPHN|nr:type III secretion system export apparatus subunit SctS [Pacificimonas pallii]MBV7256966.1 type III secretion system export apparatus subunit SctS [Pacificimonas pallii]
MGNEALDLTANALWLVLLLSAPPVLAASIVGLLVALVQAATQVQEQTLQFALKFFAIALTLFATAAVMGSALYDYADRIFTNFPGMTSV